MEAGGRERERERMREHAEAGCICSSSHARVFMFVLCLQVTVLTGPQTSAFLHESRTNRWCLWETLGSSCSSRSSLASSSHVYAKWWHVEKKKTSLFPSFPSVLRPLEWRGPAPPGGAEGNGAQQAISSRVPRVVCRGTLTVWLIDSEWFTTGSHVLWEKPNKQMLSFLKLYAWGTFHAMGSWYLNKWFEAQQAVVFTTSSPWLSSSSSRFSRSSSLSFTTCQHTSQTTISFTAKSGLKLLAWEQLCSSASAVLIKSATWVAAQGNDHRGIPGTWNHTGIENGHFDWEIHAVWSSFHL